MNTADANLQQAAADAVDVLRDPNATRHQRAKAADALARTAAIAAIFQPTRRQSR